MAEGRTVFLADGPPRRGRLPGDPGNRRQRRPGANAADAAVYLLHDESN
jgi:hypothetical protein